ncbi:MAG TPA: hypothetical protein VM692_07500 [Gammaproteobacteria bacterium]|nr:hypothetical protein [Gammaproteobacteria bacterium]
MQLDSLALRMRPRAPLEAADLGARLCQDAARSVYACYALAYVPVAALALASFELAAWLPTLVLFFAKPWLDRTILFVLSRAAFGQATTVLQLWEAQRQVWWSQLFLTLTWRRLSPWRSFTQPVYQLEGLALNKIRRRVVQIRRRKRGTALMITTAFATAETCLVTTVLSLIIWFAPGDTAPDLGTLLFDETNVLLEAASAVAYAIVIAFLEPFYVAAGFAMYLNRRAELEAWDVEQELRRAFAA